MNFEKMKDIREYFDKTQQELATVLKVSRSTYAGWENGIDSIPLTKLNDFCNYFGVSLDYMCGLSKNKKINANNNELDMTEIGVKLKEIRLKDNDTQDTVSNEINVDQSTYCRYELGQIMITTYQIIEFAKYYNISIDYICGKTKDMEIK